MSPRYPNFSIERELIEAGYGVIAGVDEAGAGALAGPLVAAAVVLPLNSRLREINDSKLKTRQARERLFEAICEKATAWSVAEATVKEINELGIRPANYLAMKRAVEKIPGANFCLVDAWTIPDLSIPQRGIIHGDRKVKCIAAASILAKVARDRTMVRLQDMYPEYGFDEHMGYGTAHHLAMIKKHGPCPIHRTSWSIFSYLSADP